MQIQEAYNWRQRCLVAPIRDNDDDDDDGDEFNVEEAPWQAVIIVAVWFTCGR